MYMLDRYRTSSYMKRWHHLTAATPDTCDLMRLPVEWPVPEARSSGIDDHDAPEYAERDLSVTAEPVVANHR
jgi:hypothetical protein